MKKTHIYKLFILSFIYWLNFSCKQKEAEIIPSETDESVYIHWLENPDAKMETILSLAPFYEEMDNLQKATFGHALFGELGKLAWPGIKDARLRKDLFEYITFSIEYYLQHKDYMRAIQCYSYKGESLMERRRYTEASKVLLEVLDMKERKDYPASSARIYFCMARLAGYQDEFTEALQYADLAISELNRAESYQEIPKIHLVKGWIFERTRDYHSALNAYNTALTFPADSITIGDIYNGIGNSYGFLNKLDSALTYSLKSLEYPYIHQNYAKRLYCIAEIYYKQHQIDSALFYVNKSLEYPIDIYFQRSAYDLLREMAINQEDSQGIAYYTQKYQEAQDTIRKITSQPGLGILQHIHELDRETVHIRTQRLYLSVVLIMLALIAVIIITILYRKHFLKQKEAAAYKTELEEKEELLDQHHTILEKRHEMLLLNLNDEFQRAKEKYAVKRAKMNFLERQELDKNIYYEVLHLGNEKAFMIKMNHILNRFPDKLKEKYPDISHKELIWCCLFILKIPNHEMCTILEYKQTSLYKFKQRLVRKLGFHAVKEFEEMLHETMNK